MGDQNFSQWKYAPLFLGVKMIELIQQRLAELEKSKHEAIMSYNRVLGMIDEDVYKRQLIHLRLEQTMPL